MREDTSPRSAQTSPEGSADGEGDVLVGASEGLCRRIFEKEASDDESLAKRRKASSILEALDLSVRDRTRLHSEQMRQTHLTGLLKPRVSCTICGRPHASAFHITGADEADFGVEENNSLPRAVREIILQREEEEHRSADQPAHETLSSMVAAQVELLPEDDAARGWEVEAAEGDTGERCR